MPKIITIYNNKGGVSKTSTTLTLAYALTQTGYKVAVFDNNLEQSDLTRCYNPSSGYDLIQEKMSKKLDLKSKYSQYDYILIDNQPSGVGETVDACLISDYVIIPTTLAESSIVGADRTIENLKETQKINKNLKILGVLVTKYDKRDKDAIAILETIQDKFDEHIMDSVIRTSSSILEASNMHTVAQLLELPWYREKKATVDFDNLAKEIINKTKM
jgi:chromosome partitioning protein